ncbi:hypothetical protein LG275_12645 [Chryseomicrobium palamuruense]
MRNKGLFILIFSAVCGLLIVFSYLAWKDQIDSIARPVERVEANSEETEQTEEVEESNESSENSTVLDESFTSALVNMDDSVRAVFEARQSAGETIQLLVLASDLVDMGSPSMSDLFIDQMTSTYGDSVEITKQTFNENSITITQQQLIDYDGDFDVVLLEPFTLKNNGEVDIDTEHSHITSIVGEFKNRVEDVAVVFTPPNPIYNASYYPVQVEALLSFLNEQDYPVIEHWDNWPDPKDELIKDYLDENSRPNSQGAAAWAQAVNTYFTGITN